MSLQFFLANAFASTPHGGNQASVVLLPKGDKRASDEAWMSAVAKDFELPMTAFCEEIEPAKGEYSMRWFTPAGLESPLCGHATLATAAVLFRLSPSLKTLNFTTKHRGTITATLASPSSSSTSNNSIEVGLSLPIAECAKPSADAARKFGPVFERATGLKADQFVQFASIEHGEGVIVEVSPDVDLAKLKVDTASLLPELQHHGVLTQVVGQGEGGVRINSRVFVPAVGIPEDPVTGSAHALLTEYYLAGPGAPRIAAITGVRNATADAQGTTLDAHQVSARGGAMKCKLVNGRAEVVGRVYQWAEGKLST